MLLCESDICNKHCTIKTWIVPRIDLEYQICVRTIIVVLYLCKKTVLLSHKYGHYILNL